MEKSVHDHAIGAQGLTSPEWIEAEQDNVTVTPWGVDDGWGVGHFGSSNQPATDEEVSGAGWEACNDSG